MSKVNMKRTPISKASKQRSVDLVFSPSNPFECDSEPAAYDLPARASSVSAIDKAIAKNQVEGRGDSAFSSSSGLSSAKKHYKNDFHDVGGIENQSVQELEKYAVYKAEETTAKVNGCLKIAEEMRDSASKTLVSLHQQGQQITRTHLTAVDMEQDLTRSEKLLGSLGGIFSKKWTPKKGRPIQGPVLTRDDSFVRKGSHMEQRQRLGLSDQLPKSRDDSFVRKGSHMEQRQRLGLSDPLPKSNHRHLPAEPTSAIERVEVEKAKQDDTLSDLSSILGELKVMATDMGAEIDRQTKAIGHMEQDVDELNVRVKGANVRGRRLLGK